MDIYLTLVPDNFDIRKYGHLIGERFLSQILKLNKDITKEGLFEDIKKDCDDLITTGFLHTNCNNFGHIKDILKELDLVVEYIEDYQYDQHDEHDQMIININSKELKPKFDLITSGGWGIKHGGWGHESKI